MFKFIKVKIIAWASHDDPLSRSEACRTVTRGEIAILFAAELAGGMQRH